MKTQKPRNQHTETLAQWWNCERVTFLSHHQFPARQPCLAGPKERHLTDCWSRSKPRNQMPQLDCFWQGAHTPKKEKKTKKSNSKKFQPPPYTDYIWMSPSNNQDHAKECNERRRPMKASNTVDKHHVSRLNKHVSKNSLCSRMIEDLVWKSAWK